MVGNFAEIELGVAGEVGAAIVLEIIEKFLASEIVFAAGDVAQAVGIEHVGGGSGRNGVARTGRSEGCVIPSCWLGVGSAAGGGGAGNFGVDALHGALQIDELLIQLAETRFNFL